MKIFHKLSYFPTAKHLCYFIKLLQNSDINIIMIHDGRNLYSRQVLFLPFLLLMMLGTDQAAVAKI